jgi:hypothetical protein
VKLPVVLAIVVVFALLRWRRAGLLTWTLAWWVGFYAALRFGFTVPIPASVIMIYMGITTLSLAAYVTSSRERREEIARPIVRLIIEPRRAAMLVAVVVAVPALAAANVYLRMSEPLEAPLFSRTVHPASPAEITVHKQKIDLNAAENPFRALESSNPAEYRRHLENGRRVYYQNCVFCHGDAMAGDGMFAHGLNPIPTNFTDPGTIAMLRETFLFWRISKGGPGLPDEGGPWDSAMPAWEKFLQVDEIWDVILFVYDFTGQKPRAKEEITEK